MDGLKKQICTKCKVKKPSTDFSVDKRATSGRCTQCKKCMAAYKRNRFKQEIVAYDFFPDYAA
jgi:NAD-dependent SIR2 family protein deacetylase